MNVCKIYSFNVLELDDMDVSLPDLKYRPQFLLNLLVT